MRKIDDKQHQRLNNALIKLKRELIQLDKREIATKMDVNRRALQSAYQNYAHSVERLLQNVNLYHEVFEEVYVNYREAVRKKKRL